MKKKNVRSDRPSLWYSNTHAVRILYPSGRVEGFLDNGIGWFNSVYSEESFKKALPDLKHQHTFVSYL